MFLDKLSKTDRLSLALIFVLFANLLEDLRFDVLLQNFKEALEKDLALVNLTLHVVLGLAPPQCRHLAQILSMQKVISP